MMTLQQKLDFVHKQTKLALEHVQHFDTGGTALGGPSTVGTQNASNSQGIGGAIGSVLGTNSNFQASGANINQGTNTAQLNQAYSGAQNALGQGNNLTNTLNPGVTQGANTQNTLTQQLQNEALGKGPNPAQTALNQNTGQNIAQQAALAASTRGAGANAGLVAQNAGQQGGALQQQAVGQEATNAAQQQLNAQNQLQNLAATQVGQGTNAVQAGNVAQQGEQNILQGANTAANQQSVSQQENINTTNAQTAAANASNNGGLFGGIGNAIGSIGKAIGSIFAEGGEVPTHLAQMAAIYHPHLVGMPPQAAAYGGNMQGELKSGGKVPGKAPIPHDDYGNDTVDAKLTPGEVVIDLNTLKDKGELGKKARFVAQNIERKKMGRKP
jgi:hypothetical protein